jgi:transcriptional regulator with XRE-family HTH domain
VRVGARIAKAREALGLSQVELAKKIGVPVGTLAGWEAGYNGIRKNRIARVAKALDLDAIELIA